MNPLSKYKSYMEISQEEGHGDTRVVSASFHYKMYFAESTFSFIGMTDDVGNFRNDELGCSKGYSGC